MKTRRIGYARVSSKDQTLERQIKMLSDVNVDNIYLDKISGLSSNKDRPKLQELLADVVIGDTIVVTELDRLGRNKKSIIKMFELIKAKGVFIEIINMPFLNTNTNNEIMTEILQPAVLNVLSYFAEKELELKKERQASAYACLPLDKNGRKISIKKNKIIGRPNKQENLTKDQIKFIKLWIKKEITTKDCIKLTGLGKTTLFNIKKHKIIDKK